MDRREFFLATAAAAVSRPATLPFLDKAEAHPTAAAINKHLRTLIAVDEPSVDRVVIGDPATVVRALGTCWMPYWDTCREAVGAGVNVLVVHEPAFYAHWDLDKQDREFYTAPADGVRVYREAVKRKREWIEKNGLVIIRCHDVLDRLPDIGIPYAFGRLLGFAPERLVRSKRFYNVYSITPAPASDVARQLAGRLKAVGQPGVAFYGDPEFKVSTVGVGTGCICDPLDYMELAPDLFVAIDDTVRTWTQTAWAHDTGRPLIVVNHGTSEEAGMRALNQRLREDYPGIEVRHFNQGCGYQWISA